MNERSKRISRLLRSYKSRVSYIKAKLVVLVPAQIKALRLRSEDPPMPRQSDLARETEMHQSRISMFETPGMANITLDTLAKIAAGLRVGVAVRFVPFSEMLAWESGFSQDEFNVIRLDHDNDFLEPAASARIGLSRHVITPAAQAAGIWCSYTTARNALNQTTPSAASYAGEALPPGRVEWAPVEHADQPAALALASGGES